MTCTLRPRWFVLLVIFGAVRTAVLAQPVAPVRVCAEWEPALGTLISWPLGLPQALVVELARDDRLYVLVRSAAHENQARATLTSWGIAADRVEYIRCNVGSIWPRDWGPHQIFDGSGQWAIIDPIFRGYPWVDTPCVPITSPGGYTGDDTVPTSVAAYLGAPVYTLHAYLTGGNFLVDGRGAAFSTCAMVGENQQLWTPAQFFALAQQYAGIAAYHVLNNTENNGIQHIDCWLKLLDEETLLVKRAPPWHEEHARIEANLATLAGLTNSNGRPYRIVRIDCPPYTHAGRIANYTNSLILNRRVFVPLFDIPADAAALATYRAALPGYEVTGFPYANWHYYDALHCRTRAVFDRHMLHLAHRRLDSEVAPAAGHRVTATIRAHSGAALLPAALRVWWRVVGASAWNSVPLVATGAPHEFAALIPGPPPGTTVEYYVAAADASGRAETLPRTAPAGAYRFTVRDTGLRVVVPAPPTVVPPWSPTTFAVTIEPGDEALVPGTARLYYRFRGGAFQAVPLVPLGGTAYAATLPRALCGDSPEYFVAAEGTRTGLKTAPPGGAAAPLAASVGTLTSRTLLEERFESGLPAGWTASGLWHVSTTCGVAPVCDGARWAYYGRDSGCNYSTGARTRGTLTAPPLGLPPVAVGGRITLTYCSLLHTENAWGYDIAGVYLGGGLVDTPAESATWQTRSVDLTAWAGQTVVLDWRFDSIDENYNTTRGWLVDRVRVTLEEPLCAFVPPFTPGDTNCSGAVDFDDIDAFVTALGGRDAYEAEYPGCFWESADCNGDRVVDFDDIDAFVALIGR